jgi:hypothetical protein
MTTMPDTCPYCHRPAVPLEHWRVGTDECGNDWLSRGGGRRNVCVAMHDCRQARDRWQAAEVKRLTAELAASRKFVGKLADELQTLRGHVARSQRAEQHLAAQLAASRGRQEVLAAFARAVLTDTDGTYLPYALSPIETEAEAVRRGLLLLVDDCDCGGSDGECRHKQLAAWLRTGTAQ